MAAMHTSRSARLGVAVLLVALCFLAVAEEYEQTSNEEVSSARPLKNVAICVFGLTRSLNYTINNFRTHLLDPLTLADINYTIYLHTYNISVITNFRSNETNVVVDPTFYKLLRPDVVAVDSEDIPKAIGSKVRKYLAKGDPWKEYHHTSLKNFLAQLHSLEAVTSLWADRANDYDAVIYTRSDLWFYRAIDLQQLQDAASSTEPRIYLPDFHQFGGVNDRFAFGNPSAMALYGNRNSMALKYSLIEQLHAERFLAYYLHEMNITQLPTGILFSRLRSNGVLRSTPVVDGGAVVSLYWENKVRKVPLRTMVWCPVGYWMMSEPALSIADV